MSYCVNFNDDLFISNLLRKYCFFTVATSNTSCSPAVFNPNVSLVANVSYSNSVFIAYNNDIYATDSNNNLVRKFSPNNSQLGTLMAPVANTTPGSGSNQLGTVQAIFVDHSLSIFISDTGYYSYYGSRNNRIQKWLNGATNGSTVAGNVWTGSVLSLTYDCSGLFIDTTGNMYISDATLHQVTKWTPNNATIGLLVAGTSVAGSNLTQLNSPKGIWLDGMNSLYIADYANHRVMKWTNGASSGTLVAGGQGQGPFPTQLYYPTSVVVDSFGNIFILDSSNQRIQQWAVGATFGITVFDGSFNGGFASGALSMSVDSIGNLYVANTNGMGIWKITLVRNSTCTGSTSYTG